MYSTLNNIELYLPSLPHPPYYPKFRLDYIPLFTKEKFLITLIKLSSKLPPSALSSIATSEVPFLSEPIIEETPQKILKYLYSHPTIHPQTLNISPLAFLTFTTNDQNTFKHIIHRDIIVPKRGEGGDRDRDRDRDREIYTLEKINLSSSYIIKLVDYKKIIGYI